VHGARCYASASDDENQAAAGAQHAFLREKILGTNDKEAALAAGYSLSVAENPKQKPWAKRQMRWAFERSEISFVANRAKLAPSSVEASEEELDKNPAGDVLLTL
jgi:hypothetical protein